LSLPIKLLLWNWRVNSHYVSSDTEEVLVGFMNTKETTVFKTTIYRLNQYAPIDDLRRLVRNKSMSWPYRLLLGLPITLISDVLLPGRVIPLGDRFNPFTNTVHIYSDDAAIALHEAGP